MCIINKRGCGKWDLFFGLVEVISLCFIGGRIVKDKILYELYLYIKCEYVKYFFVRFFFWIFFFNGEIK